MPSMFKWDVVHPEPGEAVAPNQRLTWARTTGLGAQHVVAMFGATFVFPIVMGLDPNLAIMFSGICTILFLLICSNKVPSYLGTSASFVASVAAIRSQGGDSADVTGAIMVAGIVLLLVGVLVHISGSGMIHKILPPAVTGAVVMLIGFNLAPVVAEIYWPQDQWVALLTATFMVCAAVLFPGFWARIAVFLALIFGYLISWLFDAVFGAISSPNSLNNMKVEEHDRVTWAAVKSADWIGFPSGTLGDGVSVVHGPSFSMTFILLVLPGVIALIAENTGHVKAVAEMTGEDLDPYMGRAIGADGFATALASAFGGSPTTTYAENIGVMGATRVYSTAAYYVAAVVAILLGLCPKFGAIVSATPGRSSRRDHRCAVRHDRSGGRQDLGGEPGGLRRSGEPRRPGRGHHRRHRRGDPADHRRLRAERHRPRHDPGDRLLPRGGSTSSASGSRTRRRRGDQGAVKPAPFDYLRPGSLAEAAAALAGEPNAKVLAGGQSLVPLLSMRLAAPSMLVDINGLPDLSTIEVTGDGVRIGALARHADVLASADVARVQPLLAMALSHVAHATIRNRGTTVGSIIHADAAAEMPAVLALLGGSVEVESSSGRRTIPADELFVGPLETSLQHDEIAVAAYFPALPVGCRRRLRRDLPAARGLRDVRCGCAGPGRRWVRGRSQGRLPVRQRHP